MNDQLDRTPYKFSPWYCTWEILMTPFKYGKQISSHCSSLFFSVLSWCGGGVDKLQISLVCLLQDIHDCIKHSLKGFPERMHNWVLLLCPRIKGNDYTILSKTETFSAPISTCLGETLYSSNTGYSQMMMEHNVTFICMSYGCKTWLWLPECKTASHNRSDTSILRIFLIMGARCVLHNFCEDMVTFSIQTRSVRTPFSQELDGLQGVRAPRIALHYACFQNKD